MGRLECLSAVSGEHLLPDFVKITSKHYFE